MPAWIVLALCVLAVSFTSVDAAEVDDQTRSEWRGAIRALASPDAVIRQSAAQLLEDLRSELPSRDLGESYIQVVTATLLGADCGPVREVILGEGSAARCHGRR